MNFSALVAANQAFEGISTLDFIVNYQSDDLRFDASQIELSCDSTDTWVSALYSFPGNTVGDVGRTNVRRPNDGEGFHDKKVNFITDYIYLFGENFHPYFFRLSLNFRTTLKSFTSMIAVLQFPLVVLTTPLAKLSQSQV